MTTEVDDLTDEALFKRLDKLMDMYQDSIKSLSRLQHVHERQRLFARKRVILRRYAEAVQEAVSRKLLTIH